MRYLPLLLLALLLGCRDDSVLPLPPTVSLSGGLDVTTASGPVPPGALVQLRWVAARSAAPLRTMRLLRNGVLAQAYRDSGSYAIPSEFGTLFRDSVSLRMPEAEGLEERLELQVEDAEGQVGSLAITLITAQPVVDSVLGVVLWGQGPFTAADSVAAAGGVLGSFYSLRLARVVDSAAAQPLVPDIDLSVGVRAADSLLMLVAPGRRLGVPNLGILPGGNVAFFDSTSVAWAGALGSTIAGLPLGDSTSIGLVPGRNIAWRDARRRKGIIRVVAVLPGSSPWAQRVVLDVKVLR